MKAKNCVKNKFLPSCFEYLWKYTTCGTRQFYFRWRISVTTPEEAKVNQPDFDRTILRVRRETEFARNFEDSRMRNDGFTAAWQRGQAPSQTNQPAATGGAYRGSDDPLRSEPLSQRRAPPLAPSNVYIGCLADTLISLCHMILPREQLLHM